MDKDEKRISLVSGCEMNCELIAKCARPWIIYRDMNILSWIYYCIAGNLCKVNISRFSQFDPIRESLFAKLLISTHKRELSTHES